MVPLLVYCYAIGVYRSAEIEELSFTDEHIRRLVGDKWVQAWQIRCFRRQHRALLRKCLAQLVREMHAQAATLNEPLPPPESIDWQAEPCAWDCELEAEERIRLAILFDSMDLDN